MTIAPDRKAWRTRPYRALMSYHYIKSLDLDRWFSVLSFAEPRLFGDSGAFSAWASGKPIPVDEYADWLWRVGPSRFVLYANLDVIGDWRGTEKNQRHLESRGLKPTPVFHLGAPFELLDDMMAEYPYIALGGAATVKRPILRAWLVSVFKRRERAGRGTAFHGFGITDSISARSFPFFSIDSTSWVRGQKFGKIDVFDPLKGEIVTCDLGDGKRHDRVNERVRAYGYDPGQFLDRKKFDYRDAVDCGILAFNDFEDWIRARRVVPHPLGEEIDAAGPHLYYAGNGLHDHYRIAKLLFHGTPGRETNGRARDIAAA